MSVSGYLRSELGNCVKFESYMLPDSILSQDVQRQTPTPQNKIKPFVLKANLNADDIVETKNQNSIMEDDSESNQTSCESRASALERIYSFAGNFGMKMEELLSMFGFSDGKNKTTTKNKETIENNPQDTTKTQKEKDKTEDKKEMQDTKKIEETSTKGDTKKTEEVKPKENEEKGKIKNEDKTDEKSESSMPKNPFLKE